MRFFGRTALVAGAAGGIGSAVALRLAQEGARVALVDRDAEGLERVATAVGLMGGGQRFLTLTADLTDTTQAEKVVEETLAGLGRLDVVVNAVGLYGRAPIDKLTDDLWDTQVATDLKSAYALCRSATRHMTGAGYGRVVLVGSRAALGVVGGAAAAAAKAGLLGFARALALEVGRGGVTVNVVSTHYIDTPALREEDPGAIERAAKATAVRRPGTPADVAAAVAFLASEEAGFVTGQVLSVCGGSTIGSLIW